jgi:hypothetical protein
MAFLFDLNCLSFFWLKLHFFHLLQLKVDVAHALSEVLQMEPVIPLFVLDCLSRVLLLDNISWHLLGTSGFFFPLAPLLISFLPFCDHILVGSYTFLLG